MENDMGRRWLDNAFWTDNISNKMAATAILEITDDSNKKTNQVLTVQKVTQDGTINPDYTELLEQVGEAKIDQNTEDRRKEKKQRIKEEQQKREEHERARVLEDLFNVKLKAFEVAEIKNCKDRILKSRLRKARNVVEAQAWATIIMMKELENEPETE